MSVQVKIPTQLRTLTDGQSELSLEASSVEDLLQKVELEHPGFAERVLDDTGAVRRFINIYIDGEDIRFLEGVKAPLPDRAQVSIIPSVAGG